MSGYISKCKNIQCDNSIHNIHHSKILHDIRNMRMLSKEQTAAIRKMTDNEKMQIILTYDDVMENINEILNTN